MANLPPTEAVRAVMASKHGAITDDELCRILAHCLIRDEVERMKTAAQSGRGAFLAPDSDLSAALADAYRGEVPRG